MIAKIMENFTLSYMTNALYIRPTFYKRKKIENYNKL